MTTKLFVYEVKTCVACGAKEGQLHNDFCNMEPCPICEDQFLYCECDPAEKSRQRVIFIGFPLKCDYCGDPWPDMSIGDDLKRLLPKIWRNRLLCYNCYAHIKELLTEKTLNRVSGETN